jgi:hypothetical protein
LQPAQEQADGEPSPRLNEEGQEDALGPQDGVERQEAAEAPAVNNEPSFLRRFLVLAGAIPMSPEEEARSIAILTDAFPQYDRSDLLRELRQRGSAEAVAESVLLGVFSGVPRN